MTYTAVSFISLPEVNNVSLNDQLLVVQQGIAKRTKFSSLPSAPAGPAGPPGPAGADGNKILVSNTLPQSFIGNNNDLYINYSNGDLYQKISNTWLLLGNIRGPQGQQGIPGVGSVIHYGIGAPTSDIGNDLDTYIDNVSFNIYRKVGGIWEIQGNLKGEGNQFLYGDIDPINALGDDNDVYLNQVNGKLFKKVNNSWLQIYEFTSANSSNGNNISFVNELPNDTTGNNGDIVFNTSNGYLYQKVNGEWIRRDFRGKTEQNITLEASGTITHQSTLDPNVSILVFQVDGMVKGETHILKPNNNITKLNVLFDFMQIGNPSSDYLDTHVRIIVDKNIPVDCIYGPDPIQYNHQFDKRCGIYVNTNLENDPIFTFLVEKDDIQNYHYYKMKFTKINPHCFGIIDAYFAYKGDTIALLDQDMPLCRIHLDLHNFSLNDEGYGLLL